MKYFDISPSLREGMTPAWPGDPAYARYLIMSHERGDGVEVSAITLSVHAGAHVDAPRHVLAGGTTVDSPPWDVLLGKCQVIPLTGREVVTISDLEPWVERLGTRVLLKTGFRPPTEVFGPEYVSLDPPAAEWLVERGIRLVGVDTPSVDAFESEELTVHRILGTAGVWLLENLALAEVPPGEYELIALPLPLAGAEAAPVRALLRPWGSG